MHTIEVTGSHEFPALSGPVPVTNPVAKVGSVPIWKLYVVYRPLGLMLPLMLADIGPILVAADVVTRGGPVLLPADVVKERTEPKPNDHPSV